MRNTALMLLLLLLLFFKRYAPYRACETTSSALRYSDVSSLIFSNKTNVS